MDMLTTPNLDKLALQTQETPRTKVIRYFNQVEDPRILSNRDPNPIQSFPDSNDPIVENMYEKRPLKKIVEDPVTGTFNINPKKDKSKKKTTSKVYRANMFLDLGPLNRFDSKFLGRNRLSVSSFCYFIYSSLIR